MKILQLALLVLCCYTNGMSQFSIKSDTLNRQVRWVWICENEAFTLDSTNLAINVEPKFLSEGNQLIVFMLNHFSSSPGKGGRTFVSFDHYSLVNGTVLKADSGFMELPTYDGEVYYEMEAQDEEVELTACFVTRLKISTRLAYDGKQEDFARRLLRLCVRQVRAVRRAGIPGYEYNPVDDI